MAEVPFTLQRAGNALPSYLEGVIDLAFAEADGWVVVDYKTDRGTDPDFPERRNAYRTQLALYGDAWQELTGERVKERLLWFVRSGVIEAV
jgi:ATP-dependent helicase/nuclease subunit A